jgi:hypothetical protein
LRRIDMAAIAAPLIGGFVSMLTQGCGPSQEERQQMAVQTQMEQDLMGAFNQRLYQQKETIGSLNTALSNVAAGKFPPGMDATTMAALQSRALTTTSNAYRNAAQAAGNAIAGRWGGGADPSGVLSGPEAQVFGEIAAKGAAQESDLLQQLQVENSQLGREDYMGYIKGLETMADLQDPSKLAGAMTESTKAPTQLSTEMAQQQSQMSSDIGAAATNVAAGIGSMIGMQGIKDKTQQRTNQALAQTSGGLPPGSVPITGTLTPPGIAQAPSGTAADEYALE